MKNQIASTLQASDFQRWLCAKHGYTLEQAQEFCRAGDRKRYVELFNQWQNAKREPQ